MLGSRGSVEKDFSAFVAKLGLKYFEPGELLVMGGQNTSGTCAGLNRLPPRSLWPNIVPTILALDEIRQDLDHAIVTNSVYRSSSYNACIPGAATKSQHMQFRAIDFQGKSGSPVDWAKGGGARAVENGGLWTKTYNTFVHIDCRFYGRNDGA